MSRILVASDSFKGTISSSRVGEIIAKTLHDELPDWSCDTAAIADGGEGSVDAFLSSVSGATRVVTTVKDPLGRDIDASYALVGTSHALVEMASASGLTLLGNRERDPRATSSYGTGQLIADALGRGVATVTLAIGGSATNDGGMGAICALGARLLDADGRELAGCGADLGRVASIDLAGLDPRIRDTAFCVLCDVDNPLVGPFGCSRTFGPQKGADPATVEELERGMRSYAAVLEGMFGVPVGNEAGMGAAGGLAAAAHLFLSAPLVSGIDWFLDAVGLDGLLANCDLCITGEGHADSQSARGKVISGVAKRCKGAGIPCIAIVGGMDCGAESLRSLGVQALIPTVADVCGVEEALLHAEDNLRRAAQRVFALLRIGGDLKGCAHD